MAVVKPTQSSPMDGRANAPFIEALVRNNMKYTLSLVSINEDQIKKAKEINGMRKTITHALVCGPYGQIFGTEKNCRKLYSTWRRIFPLIFDKAEEVSEYPIENYATTFDLVNILISINDPLEKAANPVWQEIEESKKQKKGFFTRLFGKEENT